jgi:hypothetical protein
VLSDRIKGGASSVSGLHLPAGAGGPQSERGEPGQLDHSGQQLLVLGDAHQSPHASAAAAVAAAQQVRQLAFYPRRVTA